MLEDQNNFEYDDNLINEQMVRDYGKKSSFRKKIIIAAISIMLVLALSLGLCFFTMFNVKKNYEFVASFASLPSPMQVETSGQVVKQVGEYEVTFDFKAAYTITGLVVEKYYYAPYKIENKLSRFDLGIVWGPLLTEDLDEYMKFKNDGKRFLNYKYSHALIEKFGDRESIIDSLSNNHMIHADNIVLKCLRNIKEWDYVKIEGFLVYVTMVNEKGVKHWDSSLSRTDHGDGACEVFYATSVTWLKLQ